ncbi:NAD-dependent epimerase/dehydratase family protein [Actinocorallia longicatena]|uniref:SDR family NAD(P)-dependent oxidoreductase n=1 Tax=Actinocorallia longicatena TaxID=111803 RepID=A0ABP6Q6M5_9ACTN
MKVLITGGTGFVGSHVTRELLGEGHEVRLLVRDPAKAGRVLGGLEGPAAEIVVGDMTDPAAVARALEGCSAVVHCAAEIGVAGGGTPRGTANVDGARTVLGQAAELGLDPIVYTSSIAVHLPTPDPVLTVGSALAEPLSEYGAQKRDVELLAADLQKRGAALTVLVVGGVYGPESPHLNDSHIALLAALETGMVAPESGLGVLDVRDLATVIAGSLRPGLGPRRFLVSGRYVTWKEWAEHLSEASGRDVPYTPVTAEEMIELGRQFDHLRASGEDVPPLSEEAAVIMSEGRPADDTATLRTFSLTYRPTTDTFRDTLTWLTREGHLA